MRGINQLMAFVVLVSLTVTVAVIISNWVIPFYREQGEKIENQTKERLECQYGSVYIRNVTYHCGDDCSLDADRNLTVEVENSGNVKIIVDKIYIKNKRGSLFAFDVEARTLSTGDVARLENISAMSCSGINNSIEGVSVIATNCPGTAYDNFPGSEVNFLNC